jgi:hypothetical protein
MEWGISSTEKINNFSPRVPYPAKLSFRIDGGIKVFQNKQKVNNMTIKSPQQSIMKGILYTENENKHNNEKTSSQPHEKKRPQLRE